MSPEADRHGATVGIDDLAIYGSTLAVAFGEIAAARGRAPHELRDTGFDRRTVTPPYEDAVTLAVNAARPLVDAVGRDAFGWLLVATESGMDYGKPLSAYVHRYLGLTTHCRNVEIKHACFGGTAAIQLATAWVRGAGPQPRRALVVMTDLARGHCGDPAELTAGSGAVATTIASDPRVFEIAPEGGCASREVYDVARPTGTTEWGDAVLSLAAYLDLLEDAWSDYHRAAAGQGAFDERFDYVLYHTPLLALVREAHQLLFDADHPDLGPAAAAESFDRMVRPALGYARALGNTYSASVYTLLAGLVDQTDAATADARVAICSYGSGSCAEVYGGRLCATARPTLARHEMASHLAERALVDIDLYERLVRETDVMTTARHYEPPRDLIPGHFERYYDGRARLVLRRVENHHRCYEWTTG